MNAVLSSSQSNGREGTEPLPYEKKQPARQGYSREGTSRFSGLPYEKKRHEHPHRGRIPRVLCALMLVALAGSTCGAASRHVVLEKHKRGYTVIIPDGLEEKVTYPAVIWLHPKGSTMNTRVRRDYGRELNERKVFLVLAESDKSGSWSASDVDYLNDVTRDLAKQFAVDDKKVVLFGYEVGGQMAFMMARKSSRRFASIITMAAYPVVSADDQTLSLPPTSASNSLSVLMVVGTADDGRALCRQAAEQLAAKKFTVGLIEVPDAGRQYMKEAKDQILKWLDDVCAGNPPSVELSPEEQAAREEFAKTALATLDEIIQEPADPAPELGVVFRFKEADVVLRMPTGWKELGEKPAYGLLTTVATPDGPLLVQVSHLKNRRGLKQAILEHQQRNSTRGIRYKTLVTNELVLDGQTWTVEQATCIAYHRKGRKVVDVPAMVTVCYLGLDEKGTDYLRVVFVYTAETSEKVSLTRLVRAVLPTVGVAQTGPENDRGDD